MKLRSRWKTLNKNVYLVTNYLLYAKIISNHLVYVSKVVSNKELVLYILNGLRLRYFSFVTTFNITHLRPFVRVLHTQLESYKRMMLVSKGTTQDSLFQENLSYGLKNYKQSKWSTITIEFSSISQKPIF